MKEFYQKTIIKGKWFYDNTVEKPVYIIEQNYDYWFEMAKSEGTLEKNEVPELNSDGIAFYIYLDSELPIHQIVDKPIGVRGGFLTVGEAQNYAKDLLPSQIIWE